MERQTKTVSVHILLFKSQKLVENSLKWLPMKNSSHSLFTLLASGKRLTETRELVSFFFFFKSLLFKSLVLKK